MPAGNPLSTSVSPQFAAVVAVTSEFGIGNGGNLPWHPKRLALDMAFLKFVTTHHYAVKGEGEGEGERRVEFEPSRGKNVVVMGRKTWDSIPPKFKPMDNRINLVITRDPAQFRYRTVQRDAYRF